MSPLERMFAIGLVICLLAAGVYAGWHHYEGLVAEKASLQDQLGEAKVAFQVEHDEHERTRELNATSEKIQADRRGTENELRKERDHYAKLLADAQRDPEARKWLDADVPRPVWCGLRQRPEGIDCNPDGPGSPARQPDGGDPKPKTVFQERLRLDYVLAGPGGRPGQLQRRQGQFASLDAAAAAAH